MQKTFKICICDDEETALQIISGCVEKIFLKRGGGNISLKSFTSAKKCVSYLKSDPVDLVFLILICPKWTAL